MSNPILIHMEKKEYTTMYVVEDKHFWYRGMRAISTVVLNKYFSKKSHNKILDAGCGTGANILFLKKYGEVKGIDISPQAVQYCSERDLKNVVKGSIDHLPFKSNAFDLVTCFDVLGQKEVASDITVMKEFYRVLKPDGTLLVRIAAYNWLYSYHDIAVHTDRRYNTRQLRKLFTKTNFQPQQITYANTFFFPVIAFLRIFRRIIPKKDNQNSDVQKMSPIVNTLCYYPLRVESKIIQYMSLPFGLSLIGVAKK